jgi:endonuclease G, mitochondrial
MKNIILLWLMLYSVQVATAQVEIRHTYYTIEFDTLLHEQLFSWYELEGATVPYDTCKRTRFHRDNGVPAQYQSSGSEYKNSGYDKGHFSPDDDFRFDKTGEAESMVYTNCAPQVPNFNRGLWKRVENFTRREAEDYGKVVVYTGGIYSNQWLQDIAIPDYYFKVIMYNGGMVCFLCKNESSDTSEPTQELEYYEVSWHALREHLDKRYELMIKAVERGVRD